jgi:alpha-1,3-glucosyltransferase
MSVLLTLLSSSPSIYAIIVYRKSSKKITLMSFFIVSMSFFLYSFHVHEKTILVPFLAFLLNFKEIKEILPTFTLVSLFSLYPLLQREDQLIPYTILMFFGYLSARFLNYLSDIQETGLLNDERGNDEDKFLYYFKLLIQLADYFAIIIVITFHILELKVLPPQNYPFMFPMINAAVSFLYFLFFYLYAVYILYTMLKKPKRKKD